ncbi:hypothetical protein G7078_10350 [Sphingomonas sinipercae]|uniref:Uncharacterized protein n=1 Tax=Sphingomonas sinipercae TaxID=2714944 RepID=A0A6G7ZQF7_9SPHN|nr:hypothetical protein [Sphingomonas sinipercae]QIL03140.1 hypothetical protein G7078_10350 [Sphingomonas sinipercae]
MSYTRLSARNATRGPHPSIGRVDATGKRRLPNDLMTNLNAIAAVRNVHQWWRALNLAARWRD